MENLNEAIITTRFVLENNSVIVSVYKDNVGVLGIKQKWIIHFSHH